MNQTMTYRTCGTCSRLLTLAISEEGLVYDVHFEGGCQGSAEILPRLAEGQPASELIERFQGQRCAKKATSCADQLAQALIRELFD